MIPKNEQMMSSQPKRGRKLELHKETIKALGAGGSPKKMVVVYPHTDEGCEGFAEDVRQGGAS